MNDQLTEVYASIDALIDYALAHLDLDPRNADWTRNQIFALRSVPCARRRRGC